MDSNKPKCGVGWATIIEYAYPSGFFSLQYRQGDINFKKNRDYFRAISNPEIKTSTVDDLIKLKKEIDEKYEQ